MGNIPILKKKKKFSSHLGTPDSSKGKAINVLSKYNSPFKKVYF